MRDYGQIQCSIWTHPDFVSLSDQGKVLMCYLLTGQHSNGLGCYRMPIGYITADLGWTEKKASETVSELFRNGFIRVCKATDFVWIPKYIRWNPPANANVAKAREKEFAGIPSSFEYFALLSKDLLEHYEYWAEPFRNRLETVCRTVSKQEPNLSEPIREDIYMSGKPDVSDEKTLNGKKETPRKQARRVLEFLNEKTGRQYRPVDANLKMIEARLKEGATETECRQVIAKKRREWEGDEKMSAYLRPATLFNATKFAQYQGELVND